MRFLLTVLLALAVGSVAIAETSTREDNSDPVRIDCPFDLVTYDWDFSVSNQGFNRITCDVEGGLSCWEWGNEAHFGNCWGTKLNANYWNSSGEGLVSPAFTVTDGSFLVQVTHYYDTQGTYDGGNLAVNNIVVAPMEGYPISYINPNVSFYAYCVEGDPGFSGHGLTDWTLITSCFDLSAFLGQNVNLMFQFGSDQGTTAPGWYITRVKVGGSPSTAVPENPGIAPETWGTIKALYR